MAKTDTQQPCSTRGARRVSDPFRTLNIVIEAKLSLDRLFFMIDGIWENLAAGYSDGLQADCAAAIPALREYGRAWRKLYRFEDKCCILSVQEKAARDAGLAWMLARFRLVIEAGARGRSNRDLRRLVDAHPELYPDTPSGALSCVSADRPSDSR
jgi:hypothetical protein